MQRQLVAGAVTCILLAGCGSTFGQGTGQSSTPSVTATAVNSGSPSPAVTPSPAADECGAQPAVEDMLSGPGLTGIQFLSARQGWAVGQKQIIATSDGGQTWKVQDSGPLDLSSVDFISGTTGWAVGADELLVTKDGQSWSELPEPCPVLRSVHFVSPLLGFAIAGGSLLLREGELAPQSSGELLATDDGGSSWRRLAAPADPQTVCFSTPTEGWLGAHGNLYRTTDGGRAWSLAAIGPRSPALPYLYTMFVQCAADSVWATDVGPGAAMSQQPHIGYHGSPAGASPIFAEQYFPHPGVNVQTNSPGSEAGVISAISAAAAIYLEFCPACGYGTAPWALVTDSGQKLARFSGISGLTIASGASFLTPALGWVTGALVTAHGQVSRIVRTEDGGHTWQVVYATR